MRRTKKKGAAAGRFPPLHLSPARGRGLAPCFQTYEELLHAHPRFDDQIIFQVAFVTPDIDKTKRWMAEFFDMPVPETVVTGERSETEAEYLGKPSDARCKLAFFNFGNTVLELLEPDHEPSCWREFLDRNGPGFHHFAFKVKGMKQKIATLEKDGYPLLQRGEFTGGRYAYVDTEKNLGALIELLEFDKEPVA